MDDDAPMSPATAGLLLVGCALIGGGFLVGLWYMNKSEDPLYKRDPRFQYWYEPQADAGTPREMQTPTNLWKDKNAEVTPPPETKTAPKQAPPPPLPAPASPGQAPQRNATTNPG